MNGLLHVITRSYQAGLPFIGARVVFFRPSIAVSYKWAAALPLIGLSFLNYLTFIILRNG